MKRLVIFWLCLITRVYGLEKLPSDYLITFGDPHASMKIVEYFSFTCPHCLAIYKSDFEAIKSKYLDTGKAIWIFHPVPMDMLTVQAMDCLQKLSEKEKRLFLESILDVITGEESPYAVLFMQKAMELFEKPITELKEKEYLSHTNAFQDAFLFIKQEEKISVVPTVEINGKLFLNEIPELKFIDMKMQGSPT